MRLMTWIWFKFEFFSKLQRSNGSKNYCCKKMRLVIWICLESSNFITINLSSINKKQNLDGNFFDFIQSVKKKVVRNEMRLVTWIR